MALGCHYKQDAAAAIAAINEAHVFQDDAQKDN
jgi:hypothetical protein